MASLKEMWQKMSVEERQKYVKEHGRAICPYCGEETSDIDSHGLLSASHIKDDWESGRTKKYRENLDPC